MATGGLTDVVIDTSTLINFLRIARVDLLAGLTSYRFVITDHVRGEVTDSYPAQLTHLEFALLAGHIHEISLTDMAEHVVYGEMKKHQLGDGESAAIAAASVRSWLLAIDDKRARNKATAFNSTLRLLDTVGLVVEAIQAGLLTIAEADAIKADWEANHRFIKSHFVSFAELVNGA
jgi:predicted nucleic acid-binding protein